MSSAYDPDLFTITPKQSTHGQHARPYFQSHLRARSDSNIGGSWASSQRTLAPPRDSREEGEEKRLEQYDRDEGPWMEGITPMGTKKEIALVAVLCSTQLLSQAGHSVVIFHLQTIAGTFKVENPAAFGWEIAAYAMTVGNFVLPFARFGDMWDHSRVLILGLWWLAASSLLTSVTSLLSTVHSSDFSSSTYDFGYICFNIGRALQGIGAAMMVSVGGMVASSIYRPGSRKETVSGLVHIMNPVGWISGALYSTLMSELVSWQWAFYILTDFCLVFAVLAIFVLPRRVDGHSHGKKSHIGFDWLGTASGLSGLMLISFAVAQGPVESWANPYLILVIFLGLLFVLLFFGTQANAKYPLIPSRLLKNKAVIVLMAIMSCGWAAFGIWIVYTSQHLGAINAQNPFQQAVEFIPIGVVGIAAFLLARILIPQIGASSVLLFSMLAFLMAVVLLAVTPPNASYFGTTLVSIVVAAFGMNLSIPAASIIAEDNFSPKDQEIIESLIDTIVNFSISMGIGIGATLQTATSMGDKDVLSGIRRASFLGIAFAGLGVALGISNIFIHSKDPDSTKATELQDMNPFNEKEVGRAQEKVTVVVEH